LISLLLTAAISQRPSPILDSLSVSILAVSVLGSPILGPCHLTVLVLAGFSYLAILLSAVALILAVTDAVLIAVFIADSCACTRTISILCCYGKTCQKA